MKACKIATMICCLGILTFLTSLKAQTQKSSQEDLVTVRNFAQDFYSWYVPKALKPQNDPASDLALNHRSSAFSPELLRALKEDSEAVARAHEIVGLDFDPFLDTQDPAKSYKLGRITQKGSTYLVEVFGESEAPPPDRPEGMPDVVAEVGRRNGRWVFTNFLYPSTAKQFPDTSNLLAILKQMERERQASKAKHPAE